jgi:hypothetical protein
MSDLNNCDCCNAQQPSIDLFWNIPWNEHTARQLAVLDAMNQAGYEAVCQDCFNTLVKAA